MVTNNKKKQILINVTLTFFCQLIIFAFGIILPKIIVTKLGSEVNGFLSTVNEIFTYVSLVEAGLSTALLNCLYSPVSKNDNLSISQILSLAQKKFRFVSLLYFLISVIIGFVLPIFLKADSLSYFQMCLSIISFGFGGAASVLLTSCVVQYLIASGHNYVKQLFHVFIYIITFLTKMLVIYLSGNVILINISYGLICLIQGFLYRIYFYKKFPDISLKNNDLAPVGTLNQRKYFFVHNISGAVFGATDIIVISIFCSLNEASIYAVYSLVFSAIATILSTLFESLKYLLGDAYSKNMDEYKKVHDMFDCLYLAFSFALLFVAYVLCNYFVNIYMNGSDINYVDKYLPLLFVAVKLLSTSRIVCNNTQNIANHAKQNLPYTIVESLINIVVSLIMVNIIGIYGVLIGTIVALLFRVNQIIIYTNKKIMDRSPFYTYKYLLVYVSIFVGGALLFNLLINLNINNYFNFVIWGLLITTISLILFFSVSLMLNRNLFIFVRKIFKRNKNEKN